MAIAAHGIEPAVEPGRGAANLGREEGAAPHCLCHQKPMFWHRDARKPPGGYWRCLERKRQINADWQRDKYDRDPVYRLAKSLHDSRLARGKRRARRRQATTPTEGGI